MTFGSGIKTKNLEAMAMGLPIVTTGIGAENINAVNGKDWIVADDNSEFADWVTDLLTDEANRYLIGKMEVTLLRIISLGMLQEKNLKNC